jgi:hypothetical protein
MEDQGANDDEAAIMEERVSTTKKKKRIIELLLEGESPGSAAKAVKTTRAQVYVWRGKDSVFADKWDDAVATGLDILESTIMRRALAGSDAMATLILKCRRGEVYNPDRQIAHNTMNVKVTTFYEAMSRIERLGLPAPIIEYDEFEDDK